MSAVRIRPLYAADLRAVDTVLMRAFATTESFSASLDRHYALQPDGWFVAESRDELLGVVAAVRFGSVAYVGMMGVDPRCQGQGLGRRLLGRLIADLSGRGCRTLLLDATPSGERLYRQVGFVDDGITFDMTRTPSNSSTDSCLSIDVDQIADLDREAFGADRRRALLRLLAEPNARAVSIEGDGYAIAQSRVIGPLIARSTAVAERLLEAVLPGPATRMMTPSENAAGVALVQRCGFQIQREARHMRLGPPVHRNRALVYGQASFALG